MSEAEPYPVRLSRRLRDADRLRAVHDAAGDEVWRERARVIADLAASMLQTEIAEVNLVTASQMRCIASADDDERDVDVELSYCQHVVGTGETVLVYESAQHALVRDSPTAARVRCYLGIPLIDGGQVLGALCVAGTQPREWTALEVALLTELTATLLTGRRAA